MKKKLGPLQLWQWGAIVGGGLGLYLLWHKKGGGEVKPEEVIPGGTAGAGLFGEGGGSGGGGGLPPFGGEGLGHLPIEGAPGPVGAPGPAGPEGTPGLATLSPDQVTEIAKQAAALNNPPTAKSHGAARAIKKRTPTHGKPKSVAHKVAKAHKEAHHQAKHERRAKPHAPKAEHLPKHAAAVAPRQHGKPAPLRLPHPNAVQHHAAPKQHPAARKPAKKRKR